MGHPAISDLCRDDFDVWRVLGGDVHEMIQARDLIVKQRIGMRASVPGQMVQKV
jgi:hypothetical protein